jgi:hypothetical protein
VPPFLFYFVQLFKNHLPLEFKSSKKQGDGQIRISAKAQTEAGNAWFQYLAVIIGLSRKKAALCDKQEK